MTLVWNPTPLKDRFNGHLETCDVCIPDPVITAIPVPQMEGRPAKNLIYAFLGTSIWSSQTTVIEHLGNNCETLHADLLQVLLLSPAFVLKWGYPARHLLEAAVLLF